MLLFACKGEPRPSPKERIPDSLQGGVHVRVDGGLKDIFVYGDNFGSTHAEEQLFITEGRVAEDGGYVATAVAVGVLKRKLFTGVDWYLTGCDGGASIG